MTLRVGNITVDCDDVLKVARFWSAALDRPLDPGGDAGAGAGGGAGGGAGFASIGRGDAGRTVPAWFFEKVPEPKTAKNRMHLDLVDSDPAAVTRLVSLGASVVAEHELSPGGQRWTVMQDPEGNEFCVASSSFTG